MKLLSTALCLTLLLCSNAQSQTPVTSADCGTVETDAGVALDLINKHRRDGYIFTLFRVTDAHEQQTGNSSVLYLTLDVLETQCSVLSRRHWEACELPQHNKMVFGQCKTIVYINRQLKKEILHGYNCTISPDHSQLNKCELCPERPTALEDIEQHRRDAERALERYNEDSNHTQYFKVDKVQRATMQIAPHAGYFVEFTIKETGCSKSTPHANVSECQFLHDRHARVGFCRGKLASDTKSPEVLEISCEIYGPWCDRPPFHRQPCSGEHHHHHHFTGKGHPPVGPSHRHHHHHGFGRGHPRRHYHRCPPPPENRVIHSEGSEHHHNFSEEEHQHGSPHHPPSCPPPPPGRPHHGHHHHGFGHGHPKRHYHRCPPSPENRVMHPEGSEHHHNFSEEEHQHGPPPPPPSDPHYLPPPPPHGCKHSHRHIHLHHQGSSNSSQERGGDEGSSSEEHVSSQTPHPFHKRQVGSIHHIPVLNQHDVLPAPAANFPDYPLVPRDPFCKCLSEKPAIQPFPQAPSESKLCPGKPKYDLPDLLPLFPPRSTQ